MYGNRCLGKGLFISNDSRKTGLNNNDLIIGGSGGGKTGCIVYPQLKMLDDASLIVADSKNMLHRMFRQELEQRGYKVRVLDFVNPEQSCMYNPLDYVRRYRDGSFNENDITKISRSLIPETSRSEPFWEQQARAVLDFFISYTLSALPKEDHNFYTVCRLYRAFIREMGEAAFIDWIEKHPDSFAANRYAEIETMRIADKMWASILGFVNLAMYPFDIRAFHHIFDTKPFPAGRGKQKGARRREKLDIASLGHEKTVVFLNISDTDHSQDGLVNLFYTQALQTLTAEADKQDDYKLPVPCRIIFDDFASGCVIPDFDKLISVVRSRDIWVTICIQSMSQLDSLYSRSQALTIVNNCDHIVFLGSNDLESAEFIGTRAGKVPEEILAMDRSSVYFIEGGKKAVPAKKLAPYTWTTE